MQYNFQEHWPMILRPSIRNLPVHFHTGSHIIIFLRKKYLNSEIRSI